MTARAPRPVVAGLAGSPSPSPDWRSSTRAAANPGGLGLVIKEVYGAGGNIGAVYNADFVELYNPTDDPISVNGFSIHYRAANGNQGGNPVALPGSVPAERPLPDPDERDGCQRCGASGARLHRSPAFSWPLPVARSSC